MVQAATLPAKPLELTVTTSANGFGRWSATVAFSHTLSESDKRAEFSLDNHWNRIRRAARRAVVKEIAERDRKTSESRVHAEHRVRRSLGRLAVTGQDLQPDNTLHSVTLGEMA